jgi:6-phosphogluconolactonase (cycloisomerase 2 family)
MRALFSLSLSALAATTAATNLYVSHYNGNVYSLALTTDSDPHARNSDATAINYTLSKISTLKTCGSMPSWLTFDASTRVLYCSDESGNSSSPGSLTALRAAADGTLSEIAKVETIGGGVSNVIYNREDGQKFIAIAH